MSYQFETGPPFATFKGRRRTQVKALIKMILFANLSILAQTSWGAESSPVEIKGDSLRQLQELRTQNVKRLSELDNALAQKIEETKAADIESEVRKLRDQKQEHLLRQEFLDRLIFQLDTKFNGGDLRAFLEHALVEMAKIDAKSTASTGDGLWKFLKYSADAIHRLPEQKENILAFLEGYMNISVSHPVLPEKYLALRNYTNGSQSESGSPLERDQVGAIAEKRLHQLSEAEKLQQPTVPTKKLQ